MALTSHRQLALVLALAFAIYAGCMFAPPHLMDDVDSTNAQISRNMLRSGDWVTARLDGVPFLEKPPLQYWIMASTYAVLGVFDWSARLHMVLAVIGLCWLTVLIGRWAFGDEEGFLAGVVLSTCIGLFLFTRVIIPDVLVTGAITLALWSMIRALDEEEKHPRAWAALMAVSMGTGVLLKGLIALVFPCAAGGLFLLITGQLFSLRTWRRLRVVTGTLLILAIAAPWHVLATLRNPPYLDFSMTSGPGLYRGFFWFYFFNEHVLRFLNRRYPLDYNTVPRHLFWLLHLVWFFPWSAYLPATFKLSYKGSDRASRMRLLCLCLSGVVMIFFTFSTTQEYYSLPIYPAVALLLGCAMTSYSRWIRVGSIVTGAIASLACAAIVAILGLVWKLPSPGDISNALVQNPDVYTLSMGHMLDLRLASFAYLKFPLALAGCAFLIGAFAAFRWRGRRAYLGLALMMALFLHAARIAMITFDPYLSSQPLAAALSRSPAGRVIIDDQYYMFASIFFYSDLERAWLLNGRVTNLEYGAYAPGAPNVFIDDGRFSQMWRESERTYLLVEKPQLTRIMALVGRDNLHVVKESGGKFLFTNLPASEGPASP